MLAPPHICPVAVGNLTTFLTQFLLIKWRHDQVFYRIHKDYTKFTWDSFPLGYKKAHCLASRLLLAWECYVPAGLHTPYCFSLWTLASTALIALGISFFPPPAPNTLARHSLYAWVHLGIQGKLPGGNSIWIECACVWLPYHPVNRHLTLDFKSDTVFTRSPPTRLDSRTKQHGDAMSEHSDLVGAQEIDSTILNWGWLIPLLLYFLMIRFGVFFSGQPFQIVQSLGWKNWGHSSS